MNLYPLNLKIEGRLAVVVGGGEVATRKVERLLSAGARVRVVSPALSKEIQAWARERPAAFEVRPRAFEDADLDGALLVFACTSDEKVNGHVLALAKKQGRLAQSASDPEGSGFTLPSEIRRGEFQLTISTGGASPALAKALRERLEEIFPEGYGLYVEILSKVREKLLGRGEATPQNTEKFRRLVSGPLEKAVLEKDWKGAEKALAEVLGEGFGLEKLGIRIM